MSHAIFRWLIDTGKDYEGMIVIADLHDGDMDNVKATEEFREIREAVELEVSQLGVFLPKLD
jgi:hypothetical protein